MPLLNSRSTGADDGKVVLYLKNNILKIGKESKLLKSFFLQSKYERACTLAKLVFILFSLILSEWVGSLKYVSPERTL